MEQCEEGACARKHYEMQSVQAGCDAVSHLRITTEYCRNRIPALNRHSDPNDKLESGGYPTFLYDPGAVFLN